MPHTWLKFPALAIIRSVKLSAKRSQQESSGTRKCGMAYQPTSIESEEQEAMTMQVDIVEQGKEEHDRV